MKTIRGRRNRWLLALGGVTLAVATSGCSVLIAQSGTSAVDIYQPETRAEVRATFGEADETRTRPDGLVVEERTFHQQTRSALGDARDAAKEWGMGGAAMSPGGVFLIGLAEVVATSVQLYRMEQAKLHYAFVYGADDRVLCRYNVADTPPERIVPAVRRLTVALYRQLDAGGCASWAGCLNAYAVEVRQRAACVDYPLTPTDEETLQLMQVLAAEVDAGRLSPDDTLAVFEWCLGSPWYQPSWSCLRP